MNVKVLVVLLSARDGKYLKFEGEIPSAYAFKGDDPETLSRKIYDEFVNYSYEWVDLNLSGCYIEYDTIYVVFRAFIDTQDVQKRESYEWQKVIDIKDEFTAKLVQKAATS